MALSKGPTRRVDPCRHQEHRGRLAYSEVLNDERSDTAAQFRARAVAWLAHHGITFERVLTDNGSCYRSRFWHHACATSGTKVKETRPRRPQTNGKVERFHRILLEEWAYIRLSTSQTQRHYDGFMHFYNRHRSHGARGWTTPASTLRNNLPAEHS